MRAGKAVTWVGAVVVTAGGALAALSFGCGGGADAGVGKAKLPEGVRSQAIEHEACNEAGHRVETVDVNGDGKPDIRRVYDGDKEICRISDLNHDGRPDMFEYYDKNGQLRRREADYDSNGVVNAIEIYENGKLVRAELDTTNQGRIDTWDTFDPNTGKRIKRERDSKGDGRVDQWWTYDGDKVTIAIDRNGDGLPDPESIVTLTSSGNVAPSGPSDAGAPGSSSDAGASAAPAPNASSSSAPVASSAAPSSPTSPTPDAGAKAPARGGAKR